MNAVNLFKLTRVNDANAFFAFEKQLSKRETLLRVKEREMYSLIGLVDTLFSYGAGYETFDDFYYSFEVPQIGKEFDLLRINEKEIINIELKSEQVSDDKIKAQLVKNKYYLSHLSRKMFLFTFVDGLEHAYQLTDSDELVKVSIEYIFTVLTNQSECFCDDISKLFSPSTFLVSPLSTPDKFLKKEYFLTSQQEDFKRKILEELDKPDEYSVIGIAGESGTGKTLLLYDLARQYADDKGKCCLMHCGVLSEGHIYLQESIRSIDIVAADKIDGTFGFSRYKCIFIDESHHLHKEQFDILVKRTKAHNIPVVFSYDSNQTIAKSEEQTAIAEQIEKLPHLVVHTLSGKIRTNKELASFIRRLFYLKAKDKYPGYPSVSVAFANDENEAKILLKSYRGEGYTFINYTESGYGKDVFGHYSDYDTHQVIGQEFDKVLMLMDETFTYNKNGVLVALEHPNPDYIYQKLLFQGLTRVRQKLAIIVIQNQPLFKNILSILK